jgi:hypothetical protein
MKVILSILALILNIGINQAQKDYINMDDLYILHNTQWSGQLRYLDYTSGKWTPVDASMTIEIKGRTIKTSMAYRYEPNKNRTSRIKLKEDGRFYGNEFVLSNLESEGFRIITTSYKGMDDNRKATLFMTYRFNTEFYSVTKEVLYKDSTERFLRNSYQFKKKKL